MSILELIKTEGAEKVILELTKEIAKKDTFIAELEKQVAGFRAMQAALGNTAPVAPVARKPRTAKKASDLKIQQAVKKIVKANTIKDLAVIHVYNCIAQVTNLQEWLSWPVEKEVADGSYNSQVFIDTGKFVVDASKVYEDFPQWPSEVPDNIIVAFNGKAMADVSTCMSRDESRFFMCGVYVDATKDKMVATDGRRLAIADIHIEGTGSAIIPVKNTDILLNSYGCRYGKEYATFDGKCFDYCVRLIDGQFPNWQRVVPQYDAPTLVLKVPTAEQFKELSDIEKLHKAQGDANTTRRIVLAPNGVCFDQLLHKPTVDMVLCNDTTAINIDYLKDSQVFGVDKFVGADGSRTVIGTAGIYTYLIMPMQSN